LDSADCRDGSDARHLEAGGYRKISPFFIIQIAPNLLAGQVSLLLNFQGQNMSIASACARAATRSAKRRRHRAW